MHSLTLSCNKSSSPVTPSKVKSSSIIYSSIFFISPGVFNDDSSFFANINVLRPCSARSSMFFIVSSSNYSFYSLNLYIIAISAPFIKFIILPSKTLLTTTLILLRELSNSITLNISYYSIALLSILIFIEFESLSTKYTIPISLQIFRSVSSS
jgi:hypothetical protein